MINNDRIVPVTRTDLLSLYALILKQSGTSVTKIDGTVEGDFAYASGTPVLCSQPVRSFDFGAASSAVAYFVAAFDYEGFKVAGAAVETAGDEVDPTAPGQLYSATLSTGTVTIAKLGL